MKKIPKKWRELPIKEKLNIPEKIFNIDKNLIKKIRQIPDAKKRLIEAARLQYELFQDIHSYLTTWIAGYSSDVIIRQKFGSTKELLDYFMKFPKINNKIKPSWSDIKRKIKIPEEMTKSLAEETGIHIGDGHLSMHIDKNNSKSYLYAIYGDLKDEYIYHTEHIFKLMKNLYNINGRFLLRKNKNNIDSRYRSKAIFEFKHKILRLPAGSKKFIKIPSEILKNNDFAKKCIGGLIDTDFSVTSSLAISGKINNLIAAKQMHKILKKNNIKHVYRKYEYYSRFYINKIGAMKILKDWHLNNIKHTSKYAIFEQFKKYIPYTTTTERLALLASKLDIKNLEKISKRRKETILAGLEPATSRLTVAHSTN